MVARREQRPVTSPGPVVRLGGRDVPVVRFTGSPPDVATAAAALAAAGLEPGTATGRRPRRRRVRAHDRRPDPVAGAVPRRPRRRARPGRRLPGRRRHRLRRDGPRRGRPRGRRRRLPGGGRGRRGHDPLARSPAAGAAGRRGPGRAAHAHRLRPRCELGVDPPWISMVASALAGSAGSLTVVVNGGPVALEDVRCSARGGAAHARRGRHRSAGRRAGRGPPRAGRRRAGSGHVGPARGRRGSARSGVAGDAIAAPA